MQVTRMSRKDVVQPQVETDFDAAIQWLRERLAAGGSEV